MSGGAGKDTDGPPAAPVAAAGETVAEWRSASGAGADRRQVAPAASRNRDPILAVVRHVLPPAGRVLEIASGTGEHVTHFARHLPGLTFQPSDRTEEALESIAAWVEAEGLANVRAPILIDLGAGEKGTEALAAVADGPFDGLVCINMVHIAPFAATEALMALAGRWLGPGAPLYLYGPYLPDGVETAESNRAFDASLKARNPAWGLRRLEDVADLAARNGFGAPEVIPMPANNLSVIFRHRA